jgi:hypothetical protein
VITSAQAQADIERRMQQDAETNINAMIASAANAVANTGSGNSGWYRAVEE